MLRTKTALPVDATRTLREPESDEPSWLTLRPGPLRDETLVLEGIRNGSTIQDLHRYAGVDADELSCVVRRLVAKGKLSRESKYAVLARLTWRQLKSSGKLK